jgi:antitoxin (DNA-binding transcriptional repressor) of toxin-antitoxin stability system
MTTAVTPHTAQETGYNPFMTRLTTQQAEARLSELVDAAVRGEEVVLVHDDQTVRLVPVEPIVGRARRGSAKGLITIVDEGAFNEPLEDFREYMETSE